MTKLKPGQHTQKLIVLAIVNNDMKTINKVVKKNRLSSLAIATLLAVVNNRRKQNGLDPFVMTDK